MYFLYCPYQITIQTITFIVTQTHTHTHTYVRAQFCAAANVLPRCQSSTLPDASANFNVDSGVRETSALYTWNLCTLNEAPSAALCAQSKLSTSIFVIFSFNNALAPAFNIKINLLYYYKHYNY